MPEVINKELLLEKLRAYAQTDEFKRKISLVDDIHSPFGAAPDGQPYGWQSLRSSIDVVRDVLQDAITIVEKACYDAGQVASTGSQKKAAVVAFLDEVIQLPALAEMIDGFVIGWCVDALISAANKKWGQSWIENIPVPGS